MPAATAIDHATYAFLNLAEPSVTSVASKPAMAHTCQVDPEVNRQGALVLAKLLSNAPTVQTIAAAFESPVTDADRSVRQLLKLSRMEKDWDGLGAAEAATESFSDAKRFVRGLSSKSIVPLPTLHADGHAVLFMQDGEAEAELEFLGKGRVVYFARRGDREWSDEIVWDGQSLPPGLSEIGFAI